MKTITGLLLVLLMSSWAPAADQIAAELKTGYFWPKDRIFRDIYGNGVPVEIKIQADVANKTTLWAGTGLFRKNGELSFTREKAILRTITVNAGLQYRFSDGPLRPYLGAGLGILFFSETALQQTFEETSFIYFGQAGVTLRLSGHVRADIEGRYSMCRFSDESIDIGGASLLAGLKYFF